MPFPNFDTVPVMPDFDELKPGNMINKVPVIGKIKQDIGDMLFYSGIGLVVLILLMRTK